MRLLLLSLVLASCGSELSPTYMTLESDIEPEFVDYVGDFLDEMSARGLYPLAGVSLPRIVHWRTLSDDTAGICLRPTPRVYIQLGMRGVMPSQSIRVTMYHELGHCMYGLEHDDMPGRIMSPSVPNHAGEWDSTEMGLELDYFAQRIRDESPAYRMSQPSPGG